MLVRLADPKDAQGMVDVINPLIKRGDTTAHQTPFTVERITNHYIQPENLLSCHVASEGETILGFQALMWANDPVNDPMPDGWAYIASFVSDNSAGKGIGHQLFEATKQLAKTAGAVAIDATIRADNIPGLGYYSKIGFVDYDRLIAVELSDGRRIDRIRKKFVL